MQPHFPLPSIAAYTPQAQAAGRSSCSAVSNRPVVPGDRGVHGRDSFLLLVRAGTNSCCKCGTARLQTFFFRGSNLAQSFSLSECPVFGKPGGRASVGELPDQFRDVHIACGFQEPRRSVRRRCPLQHPCSCCRRGTGVAGAPASNDLTLWCGLHSWRFMPPVCTGAVLVAGSHTLAGE